MSSKYNQQYFCYEDNYSDLSQNDDGILICTVNIKDVNLRQYSAPRSTACHDDYMITAVKKIYHQGLGIVECLARRKEKARNLLIPTKQLQFARQYSIPKEKD